MSEQISQLSIKELLGENVHYVIPMYQRNYAWDEAEITQLIQDVIDYLPQEHEAPQNYYIGTLVAFARQHSGNTVYETIDGQQRLTTLSLLVSHLKNSGAPGLDWFDAPRIRFESRERSQKTFAAISGGAFEPVPKGALAPQDTNAAITNGYRLIQKILPGKLKENGVDRRRFTDYLLENVVLMRVCVPPQTDLNHYFEIMNSRGEQLEKHEVLKARMMEALHGDDAAGTGQDRHCLHTVWEACANMERYVQMGFTTAQRDAVFGSGDWGRFVPADFSQLCDALVLPVAGNDAKRVALTLDEILEPARPAANAAGKADAKGEEAPERFHAVINFPNFLLHVLRVMTGENIPLDDKALIAEFDKHVFKAADPAAKIKAFVFALLRCKYLFDHYVIKREFAKGKDGWSLKRFKWNAPGERQGAGRPSYVNTFGADDEDEAVARNGNRRILMLLSAFHVSTPTRVYKHWLNAALKHLYDAREVQEKAYLDHLESVARAFVFDRYLAVGERAEYFDIIYGAQGHCRRSLADGADGGMAASLAYGHIENNLVFNFLDYLLWLKHRRNEVVGSFEFTFRSSVEHYYPQNPLEGQLRLEPAVLDSFGNLCLISHSKNSRLSNFMPTAKQEYYGNNHIDSIKQYLMMQHKVWDAAAIRAHGQEMFGVLLASLAPETAADAFD